jgi:hypothetical protein
MKIYHVTDNGTALPLVTDLAELGKLFLKLSNKHTKNDRYWIREEEI